MELFTASFPANSSLPLELPQHLDSAATLVLIFSPVSLNEARPIVASVSASFPQSVITGCSSDGDIFGGDLSDDTVVVAIVAFEKTTLRIVSKEAPTANTSQAVGEYLAISLDQSDLAGLIVLGDGRSINGSALVRGVNGKSNTDVTVTGGLAGGFHRPDAMWVVADREAKLNTATAIGFYGSHVKIGYGSAGGWDALGPIRRITKSEGNELFELDGQPALPFFQEYLGELAKDLPGSAIRSPWAIRRESEDEDFVMRTVVGIDVETGSLSFAGDVPQGSFAQLMRGNTERLIEGSAEAARRTTKSVESSEDRLTVAVSCIGRRAALESRTSEELEAALEVLGNEAYFVGFYSSGEISTNDDGTTEFHNQTMTLLTLAET